MEPNVVSNMYSDETGKNSLVSFETGNDGISDGSSWSIWTSHGGWRRLFSVISDQSGSYATIVLGHSGTIISFV